MPIVATVNQPIKRWATCLAIGNHAEVALGKLAQEKSESSEVKEFAKMMVEDHQAFLDKLKNVSPAAAQAGYLTQYQSGDRAHSGSSSAATSNDSDKRMMEPRPKVIAVKTNRDRARNPDNTLQAPVIRLQAVRLDNLTWGNQESLVRRSSRWPSRRGTAPSRTRATTKH